MKTTHDPGDIGLSEQGVNRLYAYAQTWIDCGRAPAAAVAIARNSLLLSPTGFGRIGSSTDAPSLPPDAIFLTASVTKPVTCAAVGLLMERGAVAIDAPVVEYVPEFGQNGKERVTIRHLLTHTSGLPDMIPENIAYRQRFAPLSDFITRICELPLLFDPGSDISYQSAGIALLGEVVHRVTGVPLPAFLRNEIFIPMGMKDTGLGSDGLDTGRIPLLRLSPDLDQAPWNWNRPYWRRFGAPWGGMFSTVADISRLCQMFLNRGALDGVCVMRPETADMMTTDQTGIMFGLSSETRSKQTWGLGWRINNPRGGFGEKNPPSEKTFGHYGATGTMVWADPHTGLSLAVFTTQPDLCESPEIRACSDLVMDALR